MKLGVDTFNRPLAKTLASNLPLGHLRKRERREVECPTKAYETLF